MKLTEKQRNCPYCHVGSNRPTYPLFDGYSINNVPEKKYRLVANPNSLEQTGTYATKYVACIQDGMDGFSFVYGGPTVFSEKELKQIEELHPNIAPAIDTMKEEVKDDEAD